MDRHDADDVERRAADRAINHPGAWKVRDMIKLRETPVSGYREYKPTPTDVRRACEEIQSTWSPRERSQRATIRLSELVEAIDGAASRAEIGSDP